MSKEKLINNIMIECTRIQSEVNKKFTVRHLEGFLQSLKEVSDLIHDISHPVYVVDLTKDSGGEGTESNPFSLKSFRKAVKSKR